MIDKFITRVLMTLFLFILARLNSALAIEAADFKRLGSQHTDLMI
jgi:hypothetical protein